MSDTSALQAKLSNLYQTIRSSHLKEIFAKEPDRFETFSTTAPHLFLDYSKNLISKEVIKTYFDLLNASEFEEKRLALFNGNPIHGKHLNPTEGRQVLHTALRLPESKLADETGTSTLPEFELRQEVLACRQKMKRFVDEVHAEKILGYSGKPIKSIVSIGIGGSFLGPKVVTDALESYAAPGFSCHYIANIDSSDLSRVIKAIDIETTIILIQSKTFTTIETLTNAKSLKDVCLQQGLTNKDLSQHLYAVSSNVEGAKQFGVLEDNIFPMWDWVGGRYSLWSAIGLPVAFYLGYDNFERLLQGAYEIDQHFLQTPLDSNLPVLLAVIGAWYHNFFNAQSYAVLPYCHYLRNLPMHLQQLDMESNGKQVCLDQNKTETPTGPIVWGGEGTNGQHAFHQLLHQGTHCIPSDFLLSLSPIHLTGSHHQLLLANGLSQSKALMEGKSYDQAYSELIAKGMPSAQAEELAPHKVYEGNRPSNTVIFEKLTPEVMGALVATYEHKVFVQGVLWNINSFDQWGVELGKEMGKDIFELLGNEESPAEIDCSTEGLINMYRSFNPNS